MSAWALIGLGVISAGVLGVLRRLQDAEVSLRGRTKLDPDEFFVKHFWDSPATRDVAVRLRTIFERVIEMDVSNLRGHDRFSDELVFFWASDSVVDGEIVTLSKRNSVWVES